ncbi:MAG: chaperone modulator CbpM [Bacteroidota bacterium]
METENLVLIKNLLANHQIELSFIDRLKEYGLIEIIIQENNQYLNHDQLKDFEKMMRLHYELDINLEGIDVISNLLSQINKLEEELIKVKNKLRLYED